MLGIVLALLSAAVSGISVVAVGRHNKKSNAFNISLVVTFIGLLILCPLTIVGNEFSTLNMEGVMLFAVGGILTPGLVRLFYYTGLKRIGTSVNSSVFAVYPLYSTITAVLFLNEALGLENWIGIISVVVGVVFVEFSSNNLSSGNDKNARNLIFPIVGGLTFGVSTMVRKYSLNLCNAPILGVAIAYAFSLLPFAVMLTFHKQTRDEITLKRDFRLFWIAGIGQTISWILSFYAISLDKVAVIAPILSIEPIFVVLLAYLYLKGLEQVSAKLVGSILLTVFGVILVIV